MPNAADAGALVQPVFSPDDAVEVLWHKAYQGEVLGELLFERIAARCEDPEQARKMRALSMLERRTKEAIAPSLERAGLSTDPDPEHVAAAEALAAATESLAWEELLGSFEPVTVQFIPLYVRIGELDPSERAASDLLVAHEEALRSFARLEIAGHGDVSLAAIDALPHMA